MLMFEQVLYFLRDIDATRYNIARNPTALVPVSIAIIQHFLRPSLGDCLPGIKIEC